MKAKFLFYLSRACLPFLECRSLRMKAKPEWRSFSVEASGRD